MPPVPAAASSSVPSVPPERTPTGGTASPGNSMAPLESTPTATEAAASPGNSVVPPESNPTASPPPSVTEPERLSLSIQDESTTPLLSVDVHDLHKHAIEFLEESKGYPVLADPAAGFAKLLELFAAAESKAMYAGDLKAAASILSKAATDGKLPVNLAGTTKRLASEAMKLASEVETRRIFFSLARIRSCCCLSASQIARCWSWCCTEELPLHRRDLDRQALFVDKLSALYCLSMPASLGLLPYLPATIPKDQSVLMAYIYGLIFSSASIGLVLSLHPMKRFDVELARFVSRLSFVGLSVLVLILRIVAG
ncbi:uncharacterized protein [Aegilops tauschii subsp. strangulata]